MQSGDDVMQCALGLEDLSAGKAMHHPTVGSHGDCTGGTAECITAHHHQTHVLFAAMQEGFCIAQPAVWHTSLLSSTLWQVLTMVTLSFTFVGALAGLMGMNLYFAVATTPLVSRQPVCVVCKAHFVPDTASCMSVNSCMQ